MITKMETSACVTNDVSLEPSYEYLQKRKCISLMGCSSPKGRKIKAKFERKKKQLQREDSQMKEEDIKNNTTYLDSKIYKKNSMVWL
jgi:hypothetical protein